MAKSTQKANLNLKKT